MKQHTLLKKILLSILLSTFVFFIGILTVEAQDIYTSIGDYGPDPTSALNRVDTSSPNAYFVQLFNVFIAVASVIAVIRLMLCGIQYMSKESVSSKTAAKTCITYVIGGLFLVLLSFLILQTINRDLTVVDLDTLGDELRLEVPVPGGPGGGGGGTGGTPASVKYCAFRGILCDDPTGDCRPLDFSCINRVKTQGTYCYYSIRGAQCDRGIEQCNRNLALDPEGFGVCSLEP